MAEIMDAAWINAKLMAHYAVQQPTSGDQLHESLRSKQDKNPLAKGVAMYSLITRLWIIPGLCFPAFASAGLVVEYYNPDLDHYFIAADPGEQAFVDGGTVGRWQRTGSAFPAGGDSQVCRFYGSEIGPNSHFYTADPGECDYLKSLYNPAEKSWKFESNDFAITLPASEGVCPTGLFPVYRAYNNGSARGVDSNHRITNDSAAIQEVVSRGWHDEGIVMCSAQIGTTATTPTCPSTQVIQYGICTESCTAPLVAKGGFCSPASSTTDLFQAYAENVIVGGFHSVSVYVSDSIQGGGAGCGDKAPFYDRATFEANVMAAGGSVTRSTPNEFCASDGALTQCLKKIDDTLVMDKRDAQDYSVELFMTGLVNGQMTYVNFDTQTNMASVESQAKDTSITNGGNCGSSMIRVTQTKEAVNGDWTGYKTTYAPVTQTGSTVAAKASCTNQVCTILDSSAVTITLSNFIYSSGAWLTATGASKYAGASISVDRQLLSMFVCNSPLEEAKAFENCSFYTFRHE